MAEVKWIKLDKDIFHNRKIRQIEKMPDGDALIVIWLKILTLAGDVNDNGLVYFTRDIPYTEELLATEFDRPLSTVKLALQVFQQFGMIEVVNDLIMVSNWEEYQNTEGLEKIRSQTNARVKAYRERKKIECNATCNATVTLSNATEEDIDKNKNKKKSNKFTPPTLEEVKAYCQERRNKVDPEWFIDYYASQKWQKANGRPVSDWKACVRQWEKRSSQAKADDADDAFIKAIRNINKT